MCNSTLILVMLALQVGNYNWVYNFSFASIGIEYSLARFVQILHQYMLFSLLLQLPSKFMTWIRMATYQMGSCSKF